VIDIATVPIEAVARRSVVRIIRSVHLPVDLFEGITDQLRRAQWDRSHIERVVEKTRHSDG
jgi:hypothetical protein